MTACGGQQGGSSNKRSTTASSNGSVTSSEASLITDGLEEKEARTATADDYKIFTGFPNTHLYLSDGKKKQIPVGEIIYISTGDYDLEHGYYENDNLSNIVKNLYYPASELPALSEYGRLIGTYGDIPVVEIDRKTDRITGKDKSFGNLKVYRCKLVGCTVGFVDGESAIWNQNDLIFVGDLRNVQLINPNGQICSNPLDWEFGDEVVVECDGQTYQAHADSYVYSVGDKVAEIVGGDVKVTYGGITDTLHGYDITKLDPGLYYFEGLGVYKVV